MKTYSKIEYFEKVREAISRDKFFNGFYYVVGLENIFMPNCLLGCRTVDRLVYNPKTDLLYFIVVDNNGKEEYIRWFQMDYEVINEVCAFLFG